MNVCEVLSLLTGTESTLMSVTRRTSRISHHQSPQWFPCPQLTSDSVCPPPGCPVNQLGLVLLSLPSKSHLPSGFCSQSCAPTDFPRAVPHGAACLWHGRVPSTILWPLPCHTGSQSSYARGHLYKHLLCMLMDAQ